MKNSFATMIARLFVLPSIMLLLTGPALSEEITNDEEWVQIEFIIFKYLQYDDTVLRYEPVSYKYISADSPNVLVDHMPLTPNQFALLPKNQRRLQKAYRGLRRSRNIKVMNYSAWKQNLADKEGYRPVLIREGQRYTTRNSESDELERYELSGSILIEKKRFIHAKVDLYLADFKALPVANTTRWLIDQETPWTTGDLITSALPRYQLNLDQGESLIPEHVAHLKESRKILNGEIHYLDHPRMGVIVFVGKLASADEKLEVK